MRKQRIKMGREERKGGGKGRDEDEKGEGGVKG